MKPVQILETMLEDMVNLNPRGGGHNYRGSICFCIYGAPYLPLRLSFALFSEWQVQRYILWYTMRQRRSLE